MKQISGCTIYNNLYQLKNHTLRRVVKMSNKKNELENVEPEEIEEQTADTGEEFDFDNAIQDGFDEGEKDYKRPTILVCGYTGVGKTSLISKICGNVPEGAIMDGEPGTKDYVKYENSRIRFWDSRGLEPGDGEQNFIDGTKDFIKEMREDSNVDNHIHLVWYCVQGPGARVTDTDLLLMREVFDINNELGLLTKKDITRPDQKSAMTDRMLTSGIKKENVIAVSDDDNESLKLVINRSMDILPEAYQDAFSASQQLDFELKKKRAKVIIHTASAAAALAGATPIPGSDAPILVVIQGGLIAKLAILYGIGREAAVMALGPVITQVVGIAASSSLIKFIPGIGSGIQAVVAGALTEALGWIAQAYLEMCAKAKLNGEEIPGFDLTKEDISLIIKSLKSK